MLDLVKCAYCDVMFDPESWDEMAYHGFGRCMNPDEKMTEVGKRGEWVDDEKPQ